VADAKRHGGFGGLELAQDHIAHREEAACFLKEPGGQSAVYGIEKERTPDGPGQGRIQPDDRQMHQSFQDLSEENEAQCSVQGWQESRARFLAPEDKD